MAFSPHTKGLQARAAELLRTLENGNRSDFVAALQQLQPDQAAVVVLYMIVLHGDGDPDGLYRTADDMLNALEARVHVR